MRNGDLDLDFFVKAKGVRRHKLVVKAITIRNQGLVPMRLADGFEILTAGRWLATLRRLAEQKRGVLMTVVAHGRPLIRWQFYAVINNVLPVAFNSRPGVSAEITVKRDD